MAKATLLLTIFLLISVCYAQECHYSCYTCQSQYYSSCTSCPNGASMTFLPDKKVATIGTCAPLMTSLYNPLGICYLALLIVLCVIFQDEEIIYLTLFIQTLGLFYMLQLNWWQGVDYILNGLTYFMLMSKITYNSKPNTPLPNDTNVIKGRIFFKEFDIAYNIEGIGLANIIVVGILVIIAILRYIKTNYKVGCGSKQTNAKITMVFCTFFIFLIQEMMVVIYFSLRYGNNLPIQIGFATLYLSCLMLFSAYVFISPLQYFRKKSAQLNVIIGKVLTPIFVAVHTNVDSIAFLFVLINLIIDLGLTYKNRRPREFNRLLVYKFIGLGVLTLMTIYYGLEVGLASQNTSAIVGKVLTAALCLFMSLPFIQIIIHIRGKCCNVKQNKVEEDKYSLKIESRIKKDRTSNYPNSEMLSNNPHFLGLGSSEPDPQDSLNTTKRTFLSQNKIPLNNLVPIREEDIKLEQSPMKKKELEKNKSKNKNKKQNKGQIQISSNPLNDVFSNQKYFHSVSKTQLPSSTENSPQKSKRTLEPFGIEQKQPESRQQEKEHDQNKSEDKSGMNFLMMFAKGMDNKQKK